MDNRYESEPKAVLLDTINETAAEKFKAGGFEVQTYPKGIPENELIEALQGAEFLGLRSGPDIPAGVIENAKDLLAIGCYCVGTNQVNKDAAEESGVAIFNSPYDNGRSVAELVIGNTFSLLRRTQEHNLRLHEGKWIKTDKDSYEVKGKTMGIIGYGNIGQQTGVLAEAVGMQVIYTDLEDRPRIGNAQAGTLDDVLENSHVVTIHVPGGEDKPLINWEEFEKMLPGACFINTARPQAVNSVALKYYLDQNKLNGAALDVHPDEPAKNEEEFKSLFQDNPRVLLTPHVGGSTQEAQIDAASTVTNKFLKYFHTGTSNGSVNLPHVDLGAPQTETRVAYIHRNRPGAEAEIGNLFKEMNINISAEILRTKNNLGYGIYDIETRGNTDELLASARGLEGCVKARRAKLV